MATQHSSEDEWSLVSEEEDVLSNMSFDEVEAEPEVDKAKEVLPVNCEDNDSTAAPTVDEQTDTGFSLLEDSYASERSFEGYTREIRVSLLSPAHQEWFAEPPPLHSLQASTGSSRKRNIKAAFCSPVVCHRSFPDRLRAAAAATRPATEEVEQPTFSEVTAFKQDQATQANLDAPAPTSQITRNELFQSVLERSMEMATQLRCKSQEIERLSLRIADLEGAAVQAERKAQWYEMKIKLNERSIALSKQRAVLSTEYQDNLKSISNDLRQENAQLQAQNAALRGEDQILSTRSLDEIEELEDALASGVESVRAALRIKYRTAMEKRRERELCVVCLAQPVSVILLPCRHQVLCGACAVRVTSCPIDRKDIQDKVLTYGLNAYTD